MMNRHWKSVSLLLGLWVASCAVAYFSGRQLGDARVEPASIGEKKALAYVVTEVGEDADVASQTPSAVADVRRTAATYGYTDLQFTPELGEELIRLSALGKEDYIASYVGLDELSRSMGPEAVKAALVFLKEKGMFEVQELGAPGHMSFRLGMLLGEEGVEFARSLGADVENTALGWCQADPKAGLIWLHTYLAASEENELDMYEETYWEWAIQSHPEATLEHFVEQLKAGSDLGARSWMIAREIFAIGSELERWDLLEAHMEPLIELGESTHLFTNAFAHRIAAEDPWKALKSSDTDVPIALRQAISNSAIEMLMEQEPVALFEYLTDDAGPVSIDASDALMVDQAYEIPQEALLQVLSSDTLPAALRAKLTFGLDVQLRGDGDPQASWEMISELEMPSVVRRRLSNTLASRWLEENPERAKAQLFAAENIDPRVTAMVREGRPNWEIQLMLEDASRNIEHTASEAELKEHEAYFEMVFK